MFVKVECYHLGKVSKEGSEVDLWNWDKDSTDQNTEYTPATDVNTVAKNVAISTALKRTTKEHQATTNTGSKITIE